MFEICKCLCMAQPETENIKGLSKLMFFFLINQITFFNVFYICLFD